MNWSRKSAKKSTFLLSVCDKTLSYVQIQLKLFYLLSAISAVMSFDDSRSSRMESIKQGACDYWKKPFHEDQVRNMWVHVARKAWNDNKVDIKCGRLEDNDKRKREENDSKATRGGVKRGREPKRVNAGTSSKRQRIVWTDELHNKFLDAVSQLGDINSMILQQLILSFSFVLYPYNFLIIIFQLLCQKEFLN